jgi:hypothetical protein
MNRSIALFCVAFAVLVSACAPLSEQAIRDLARESNSIRPLAESLAQADGGAVHSLDNDRFLAEVSADTLSREQFVQTLSTQCQRAHGGELKTSSEQFRLAPEDIREHQLRALAGRDGPITLYLGDALSRTLNSDINAAIRRLQDKAEEQRGERLYRQAALVCTSYGDNGLLRIHHLVSYLTKNSAGQGDAIWAVATESAFEEAIQDELDRAETAAGRSMSKERDNVAHYKALKNAGELVIQAELSRPGVYGDQFRMDVTLDNHTAEPVNVDPVPSILRSGAGQSWSTDHDGWIREGENHCRRLEGTRVQVPGGQECTARFWLLVGGFRMPNMLIEANLAGSTLELRPVTEFEVRRNEAR